MSTTRAHIEALLRQYQPYLAAKYGVRRIGLFGSFAKDMPDEASDVDIVVEFSRPIGLQFVEFAEFLEQLVGRKVDILTPDGIRGIRVDRVAQSILESIVYV